MALLSDMQSVLLAVFSVYFLKYLCVIPASVTCPVQLTRSGSAERHLANTEDSMQLCELLML